MQTEARPTRSPKLLLASLLVALLIVPAIFLATHLATAARPGGDGLVGFLEAAIVYLPGILLSWALAITGLIRGERPRWLAVATLLLGIAPLFVLGL